MKNILFDLMRENERLKLQNNILQKQNNELLQYQQTMQSQWNNWWCYDGRLQPKEAENEQN